MSEGRGLAREVAVYGLATAALQGTTVLLTPVLTRALGPTDYGVFELLQIGVLLAGVVLVAGVDTAAIKLYYDVDRRDGSTLLSSGLAFVLATTGVAAVVLVLLAPAIGGLLAGEGDMTTAVVVAAVALPTTSVMLFARQTLRILHRPWSFFAASLVGAVTQAAVVIGLVVVRPSVAAAFIGIAAGAVLSLIVSLVLGRHAYRLAFSFGLVRRLLRFGAPLIATSIAGWSVMFADRVIVAGLLSLEEVGYYALANKVSLVLNLVIYTFGAAWPPYILRLSARDEDAGRRLRADTLRQFLVAVAAVGVPAAVFAPQIVRIVGGAAFEPAARCIPILVLAFLTFATLPVLQTAMLTKEKTRAMALPSVAAALINLVGCFLLVPVWGIEGAAWATVAGFAFQAAVFSRLAQRIDPAPYDRRALAWFAAIVVPYLALGWWDASLLATLVVKVPLLLALPVLLRAAGVVDVGALKEIVRGPRAADGTPLVDE